MLPDGRDFTIHSGSLTPGTFSVFDDGDFLPKLRCNAVDGPIALLIDVLTPDESHVQIMMYEQQL